MKAIEDHFFLIPISVHPLVKITSIVKVIHIFLNTFYLLYICVAIKICHLY